VRLAAAAVTSSSCTVIILAPLPPWGVTIIFGVGRGGAVVVIVIHVRSPHVVKETPGIVVVRMGEDDRPSPTTTRHVLPLWRLGADDKNDGTVVPLQGSEFFEDVKGDYHDGLQNEDGKDHIAPGSAILTDAKARALSNWEERGLPVCELHPREQGCILVGVEDLSRARRARRKMALRHRNND